MLQAVYKKKTVFLLGRAFQGFVNQFKWTAAPGEIGRRWLPSGDNLQILNNYGFLPCTVTAYLALKKSIPIDMFGRGYTDLNDHLKI